MKPGVCCFGRDLGMPETTPEPTTTYPWHTSWPYTTGAPPLAPCGEECLVPVSHLKKSNINMSLFVLRKEQNVAKMILKPRQIRLLMEKKLILILGLLQPE